MCCVTSVKRQQLLATNLSRTLRLHLFTFNNNHIQRRNSTYFLQSPHCAAICLQHVLSSGQHAIVSKSRATHPSGYHMQHVMCHVVSRVSSAIKFDKVGIACILAVFYCLFVGWLTSPQHASVSQGRICSDNFTCCHTEMEAADPTFYLTQSQYTYTGPTSPSADPITPGACILLPDTIDLVVTTFSLWEGHVISQWDDT